MREINRKIIYEYFFRYEQLSRVDLCRLTELKAPTVSTIIQGLCNEGLLIRCGKGEGSQNGGPQPVLYQINTTGCLFAGIDVCQEGITFVLLDEHFNRIHYQRRTIEEQSLDTTLREMTEEIQAIANQRKAVIKAVGIAASGMVDHDRGCVTLSSIPELDGFAFTPFFQGNFGWLPYVDNDINILLTNAVYNSTEVKTISSILCFCMRRYGVGMSFAANGQLYRGCHNLSGNMTLFKERKATLDVLDQIAEKLPERTELRESKRFTILKQALQEGDRTIIEQVKEALDSMCHCIVSLQSVFDTEAVTICCEMFDDCPELFQYMVEKCGAIYSPRYQKTKYIRLPMSDTLFAESAAECAFRHAFELK